MKFDVGRNAEATADVLWQAAGNISGSINENRPTRRESESAESLDWQQV